MACVFFFVVAHRRVVCFCVLLPRFLAHKIEILGIRSIHFSKTILNSSLFHESKDNSYLTSYLLHLYLSEESMMIHLSSSTSSNNQGAASSPQQQAAATEGGSASSSAFHNPQGEAAASQQQQQQLQQGLLAASGGNTSATGTPVASFLRPGNNMMPGMMLPSAQPQQQALNQQQAASSSSFNLQENLKRLQQLQQLQQQQQQQNSSQQQQQLQQPQPQALLGSSQQQQQQVDPSASILQSYLDQKVQTSRLEDVAFRQMAGIGGMNMMNMPMNHGMPMNGMPMNMNNLFALQQSMASMGGAGMMPTGGIDPSSMPPLPSPHSLFHRDGTRRMRGGVIEPFPEKLHRLLSETEAMGQTDIISWVAGGRAFVIRHPQRFFQDVVPLYFRQSRLSSFKRQLNLYGFELINSGPARGGYFHELFHKDHPELCRRMRRVAVKVNPHHNKAKTAASTLPDIKNDNDITKTNTINPTAAPNQMEPAPLGGQQAQEAPPAATAE